MTLNSYSEMKGYKCNTVEKVKKEWVCITTTKSKSLDENELGWYNWLGIPESNMKHPIKTVKWYWCNEVPTFIQLPPVW